MVKFPPVGRVRRRASEEVAFAVTAAVLCACSLAMAAESASPASVPTFNKDVAPILMRNCAKCHRSGELASKVPLLTYDDARARVDLIKHKVVAREMPPWPVDSTHSVEFRNDPRLSLRDIRTIAAWADAGAPKGNDADLPPMPIADETWAHPQGRKPDLVISLPGDVHVPAEGSIPYVKVLVKVPFLEDRWVSASQAKPSNPAVVHHMALTEISLPDGMSPADADQAARRSGLPAAVFTTPAVTTPTTSPQPDMLAIYTPGSTLEMYEDHAAKLLRGGKNMYVIFDIHYETTGKPEIDRSSIALWFAPHAPEHQLFRVNGAGETILANGKELLVDAPGEKAEGTHVAIPPIPPFAQDYELTGITGYLEPVTIYQFHPHAHDRGKQFTYSVVYPDGREQTVLSVPRFDHRWQMAYELAYPLKLPAGSKLIVTAHYDNSRNNPHNPAPEKAVYFRAMNQSWDEMFTPFIQFSLDDRDPSQPRDPVSGATDAGQASDTRLKEHSGTLQIGQALGCLNEDAKGQWILTHATEPTVSQMQATSAAALKAAETTALGDKRYPFLGVRFFLPENLRDHKVAVKGILLGDGDNLRINVTSLQMIASGCAQ
jgi:hypothetical protein